MDCSERTVHEHFDRHPRGRVEPFHLRRSAGSRKQRLIEIANQSICPGLLGKRCRATRCVAVNEERVTTMVKGARLWRLHLQPARRPVARIVPGVPYARTDQSEVAGTQFVISFSDLCDHASAQYIKTLLEGMDMRLDDSIRVKETDTHPHMH